MSRSIASSSRLSPFATLPVELPQIYINSNPTPFQIPQPLTSFSYSPNRTLLLASRKNEALAEYSEPILGSDLNCGFNECIWRSGEEDEGLDSLLASIEDWSKNDETGEAKELLNKIHVITWRGMITKLLLAAYEVENANGNDRSRAESWEMNAMVIDGVLYLEEANSPEKLAKRKESESSYLLQSYYGYSFEAFSTKPLWTTSSLPTSIAASTVEIDRAQEFSPPNTNVQWCSVVKTNLGGMRIILGGEVDCVVPSSSKGKGKEIDPRDFVELKTNLIITNKREEIMFERQKLLKHYVQSFLLGVPRIIVGYRTRPGILSALQTFKTLEIPKLVRGKPHAWDPAACLTAGKSLLAFIHSQISSHPLNKFHQSTFERKKSIGSDRKQLDQDLIEESIEWTIFRVKFDPSGPLGKGECTLRLLQDEEVRQEVLGAKRKGIKRVGFLPTTWINNIRQRKNSIASHH